MVTHWESSTRPLFVRTVWRDGQHHVVLRREEEPPRRPATSPSTARSARSAKKCPSASVKLLLSGVGAFASPERKLVHKRAVKTAPEGKKTMGSSKNVNLSIKSNSIDVNVGTVSPYFSYNCPEPSNDSLSERVMVWLDLATQNRNCDTKRTVTASHVTQKPRQAFAKRKSMLDFTESFKSSPEKDLQVQGTSRALQSSDFSSLDHPESLDVVDEFPKEDHGLSSVVEQNAVVKNLEPSFPKKQMSSVKRQLHIFMPNLTKSSDCDSSILSSKISASSSKL